MQYPWPSQNGSINYISSPPSLHWVENQRKIVLLGSTGSIGVNALKVIQSQPHFFEVIGLAAAFNVQRLAEQAAIFRPQYLAVYDQAGADLLCKLLRPLGRKGYNPEIVLGQKGYTYLASLEHANTVLSAQVGAAGLRATIAAALAGKVIGLANKESLVLAGSLLRQICAITKAVILPIDSEHNALFQMLCSRNADDIKKLILTASGGPFRGQTRYELQFVTKEQALAHPNWSMGAKISIDSATLMNKGLEVIEAKHLYGLNANKLGVTIHPQSIVHSLVEFKDNSLMAHLGTPNMRMPIGHCLLWPFCLDVDVPELNLMNMGELSFSEPDTQSFPCLDLALHAMKFGQEACIILNSANEVAVELFLNEKISFLDIPLLIENTLKCHESFWQNQEPINTIIEKNGQGSGKIDDDKIEKILKQIFALDNATRHHILSMVDIQERT